MIRAAACLLTVATVVSCATSPSGTTAPGELPDLVLVTLDTVRADRIGAYGYPDAATDTLDALADRGRVYERAYSPLPLTIPAHAALFTGIYPPSLNIRSNGMGRLEPGQRTLAEHLRASGYATAASVAAFVTSRVWGFDQGFDEFFDDIPRHEAGALWQEERPAEPVIDDILEWKSRVDAAAKPLFAWVHLYDAHAPYRPPRSYFDVVGNRPYQGEIAYIDDQLQRLVDAFPDAIFVIVADHGEALGEHLEQTHGLFVYDSTQRVPWIIAGPGVEPARIETPVSLVDVAPTLLDLLGLPPMETSIDGHPVPEAAGRAVYMESYQLQQRFGIAPHIAVVDGALKLIDLPEPELYDLKADPGEQRNLAKTSPRDVHRLRQKLAEWDFAAPSAETSSPVDPDVLEQLAALGYVNSGFVAEPTGPLPDPKRRSDLIVKSQLVDQAMREAKLDLAAELLDELRTLAPSAVEFHLRRAALHGRMGELEAAGDVVEEGLRHNPDSPGLKAALGTQRARTGRHREASLLFQEAASLMPHDPRVRAHAVAAMLEAGRGGDEGVELGMRYLEMDSDDLAVAGLVGVALAKRGEIERAYPLLSRAIEADKPEPDVAYTMSMRAFEQDDLAEARRLLELELRHHPRNDKARVSLLRLLASRQEWEAIVDLMAFPIEHGSSVLDFWHANAQARFNLADHRAARAALDKAIERFPAASVLLMLDANLMLQEGQPMEACRARFEEANVARRAELARSEPALSPTMQ